MVFRYIARPAIATERLSVNSRGQVVYRLKKPYDDGTSHIIMEPLELLEKLAAIVPRPRVHLTRFHGAPAPHEIDSAFASLVLRTSLWCSRCAKRFQLFWGGYWTNLAIRNLSWTARATDEAYPLWRCLTLRHQLSVAD
jgi:hypothetical protein